MPHSVPGFPVCIAILLSCCCLRSVFSQDCPAGQFGPTCSGVCHCLDIELCNSDTGQCGGKCEKGYYKPPICQEECPDGMFGMDCDETCHCMNNSICNKKSGYCPNNLCHQDWYSSGCSQRLPKLLFPPLVSEATCSYLTVTWPVWNAETDFGDLELPVAQYRLYSSLNVSSGVWKLQRTFSANENVTATQFSYNVTGLLPDLFYTFRVDLHGSNDGKVVEKHSIGFASDPPTRVPCTTTTVAPPVTKPVIVGSEIFSTMKADREGTDSLLITWSIDLDLQRFTWNITLAYQLTGIGDYSALDEEMVVTVPVAQSDTQYRLEQLRTWSRYEVTLMAQGTGIISTSNGSEVITSVTGEVTSPTTKATSRLSTQSHQLSSTVNWLLLLSLFA